MPTGRTTVAYQPTQLTEEEAAAIAAEQAAAYGSDYAPAEAPPAEPVAAPAPQTTMYQPSSPPPAAAPVDTGGVAYASEPVGGNDSISKVPESQGYGTAYYTSSPEPYQPAQPPPMWSSPSPQVNDSQFALTPSEARDPFGTNQGQTVAYSPAQKSKGDAEFAAGNTSSVNMTEGSLRDRMGDNLGRSLGLNPNDPNEDMYNQATRRLYDWAGDRLPEVGRTVAGTVGREIPRAINQMYLDPLRTLASPLTGAGNLSGPLSNLIRAEAGLVEDVLGPHGNLLRQIQSTADPLGEAISGLTQPKTDALRDLVEEGKQNWDTFNDRTGNLIEGKEDVGQAVDDFLSFPLPSFGQEAPQAVDPHNVPMDLTLPLKVGGIMRGLGFEAGAAGRAKVDEALGGETAQALTTSAAEAAQRGRGAAIGARMRGGTPLDAAMAAAGAVLPESLPSIPSGTLRDLVPVETIDKSYKAPPVAPSSPGKVSNYTPRNPDAPTPVVVPARSNEIFQNDIPWPWRRDEEPTEPVAGSTGSVRTSSTVTDPKVIQRAREAAAAAKNWAAGLDMPDVNLPSINLPSYQPAEPTLGEGAPLNIRRASPQQTVEEGAPLPVRRTPMPPRTVEEGSQLVVRRAGDETPIWGGIDPNALYMPEAPPPSLMDRARNTVSGLVPDSLPDVSLPDVDLPDVTLPNVGLPGRGGESTTAQGGPGTGGRSAPSETDPLQQVFTEQQSGATRTATQPEGTSLAQEAGANWIKDANGNYVGLVDPNTGEYVMLPANATNEEKQAIVDGILSATPSNPAPGPATASQPTTATGTTTSNTSNSTGNASGGSTTSGSSGNSNSGGSTSGGGSTGRRTRSSNESYDDEDTAPLKLDDFIQDFDGDGVISKRDRMQGKKAFEEAKAARSKKRRGKTTSRKNSTNNFPFNRPPSPIRTQVLNAIAESQGRA